MATRVRIKFPNGIDAKSSIISNVATPVNSKDVANKSYADSHLIPQTSVVSRTFRVTSASAQIYTLTENQLGSIFVIDIVPDSSSSPTSVSNAVNIVLPALSSLSSVSYLKKTLISNISSTSYQYGITISVASGDNIVGSSSLIVNSADQISIFANSTPVWTFFINRYNGVERLISTKLFTIAYVTDTTQYGNRIEKSAGSVNVTRYNTGEYSVFVPNSSSIKPIVVASLSQPDVDTTTTSNPEVVDYCVYLNGATNSYYSTSATGVCDFGTGPYTIEFWFKTGVKGGYIYASNMMSIYVSTAGYLTVSSSNFTASYAVNVADSTWRNVVVTRNASNTVTLYVNRTSIASKIDTTNFTGTGTLYFGIPNSSPTSGFNGCISGLRISKTSITPSVQSVSLTALPTTTLLAFNQPTVTNLSASGVSYIYGCLPYVSATNVTDIVMNNGSKLIFGNSASISPSGGQFTIEFYIKTTYSFGALILYSAKGTISDYSTPTIGLSGGCITYTSLSTTSPSTGATLTSAINDGKWHHVAIVKNSSNVGGVSCYVDGKNTGKVTADTMTYTGSTGNGYIGPGSNVSSGVTYYLRAFRMTKGKAVYTADFAPPAYSDNLSSTVSGATVPFLLGQTPTSPYNQGSGGTVTPNFYTEFASAYVTLSTTAQATQRMISIDDTYSDPTILVKLTDGTPINSALTMIVSSSI